jgi:hypothetical protein
VKQTNLTELVINDFEENKTVVADGFNNSSWVAE